MLNLVVAHKEEYNNFVLNHASGSFLQSWQWGEWQAELGKKVFRFFVIENEEAVLALQVVQTPLAKLKKNYLYIPYGPLLAKTSNEKIIKFCFEELLRKFPDSVFLRVEAKDELSLIAPYYSQPTAHTQPGKTLILDLTKPEDILLAEMHHKTRYNIKVAQKHNVEIVSELVVTPGHGLHMKEVAEMLTTTAKRQNYKDHGFGYYKKMIDFFGLKIHDQLKLTVYKAIYDKKLLASAIMLDFGTTRTYLFGGTSAENKNVMAPYLLHWQAILDAKNLGYKFYDFWGTETAKGSTPGFVRFKLGFGGNEISYPKAFDIVNKKTWYNIYKSLRFVKEKLRK